MSTSGEKAKRLIERFSKLRPFSQLLEDLSQGPYGPIPDDPLIPGPFTWTAEGQAKRLNFLKERAGVELSALSGQIPLPNPDHYQGNIENFIGMTQVPTGVIGPVRINGTEAVGDYYVPLSTTEGALVSSYNRGARAARLSGGITSICLTEGIQRAPLFKFDTLPEVGTFMYWLLDQMPVFLKIVAENSRFAKLEDLRVNMEGNHVIVIFEYTTGDAAGQNMVTLCTDAICRYILAESPIKPRFWFIEGNYSGDKKATAVSFGTVRGKKVTAEALIKRQIVKDILTTTPEDVATYWQSSSVASVQSGSIGIQGHFANGLTALFLACGQDVACVAEAFVGITRMEVHPTGDLYVAVTLPSLMVGTVGGGTRLATQSECLRLLGCQGEGRARKFAEICGATILSGELSIAAALASGKFSKAHRLFGRKK